MGCGVVIIDTAIINLMPRQTQTETVSQLEHLTDAELDLLERMLASERAKTVQAIDVVAESNGAIIEASTESKTGQD